MTDDPHEPAPSSPAHPPSQTQAGLAKSLFADIAGDMDDLGPRKRARPTPKARTPMATAAVPVKRGETLRADPAEAAPEPEPEPEPEPDPDTAASEASEAVFTAAAAAPAEVSPRGESLADAPPAAPEQAVLDGLPPTPRAVEPEIVPKAVPPASEAVEPAVVPPRPREAPAASAASPASPSTSGTARRGRPVIPWFLAVVALAIAVASAVLATGLWSPSAPKVNSTAWTGVLMSNNDVFFGHVKQISADRIELTNVYYLQKPSGTDQTQSVAIVSLVANQIQCPKDDITINRADVAYWEELQDKSYVVQRLSQIGQTPQSCYAGPAAAAAPAPAAGTPAQPTPVPAPTR